MREGNDVSILGGLLKRIGNFSPRFFAKSFDHRLVFQKTIYLLQSFGLYLGYSFSWYIRGPYSPALTRKGYELVHKFEKSPNISFVEGSSEDRFRDFLDFLGEKKNDANWLETLASLHFLKQIYPRRTKVQIMRMVLLKQPYLTLAECERAWDYLRKYELID